MLASLLDTGACSYSTTCIFSRSIGHVHSLFVAICMILHCEGRWEEELMRRSLLSKSPAGHISLPVRACTDCQMGGKPVMAAYHNLLRVC